MSGQLFLHVWQEGRAGSSGHRYFVDDAEVTGEQFDEWRPEWDDVPMIDGGCFTRKPKETR